MRLIAKKTNSSLLVAILLVLAAACTEIQEPADDIPPADVPGRLYLSSEQALEGQEFTIRVMAEDITGLYGFQFNVDYDAEALEYAGMESSAALEAFGFPDNVFCVGENTETAGLIKNIACTRLGKIGNAALDGAVFEIAFKALKAGSTEISISNLKALDSELKEVSVGVEHIVVTVN